MHALLIMLPSLYFLTISSFNLSSSHAVPTEQKPAGVPHSHVLDKEKTRPNGCRLLLLMAQGAAQPHAPRGSGLGLHCPCSGHCMRWRYQGEGCTESHQTRDADQGRSRQHSEDPAKRPTAVAGEVGGGRGECEALGAKGRDCVKEEGVSTSLF